MVTTDVSKTEIKDAKILIVDDSITALKEMKNILSDYNFGNVLTCQDPKKVKTVFANSYPELVILDHEMPVLDGLDVLDVLRENFASINLNVLFWTASSKESVVTEALQKGAGDVLSKGEISREEILCRVRNQLESHLYRQKLHQKNRNLNRDIQEHKQALQEANLETIDRLVKAAEFRDNETAGHIERIGILAKHLANYLGLDSSLCKAIEYGAKMHDVGKLGVPDEILFKPDELTQEEWEIMKEHSIYGARILSGSDSKYIQIAQNIANYHHENWNGQGYPEGLEKTNIPLESRLTAVCDVFDAVMSDRPYKDPWTYDEAIELIRNEKGTKFDPDIAECFLNHVEDMIELRENHELEESKIDPSKDQVATKK